MLISESGGRVTVQWTSRWLEPGETADIDALKSQLHLEVKRDA